ncbi:MAG TPA: NADH-quinone oxidoreductase subunit NuoI [Armatimonadota bacterium]|jgi:NADH-quinone oxidoreductase subunit I
MPKEVGGHQSAVGKTANTVRSFSKGLATTFKHLFRPKVTMSYPEEKWVPYPRFRGLHQLRRYADGLEMCIGCSLCEAACPSDCIYVEPAENTPEDRHSPGERYAKTYDINMLRCIFCGYCVEACPTTAIVMTGDYELANYDRKDFIYHKDRLLVDKPENNAPLSPLEAV